MFEDFEKNNDIAISLIKLLNFIDSQVNYYQEEMDKHQINSTDMYVLGKPDRNFRDLVCQQDEWKYMKQHLIDRAGMLLYNNKLF